MSLEQTLSNWLQQPPAAFSVLFKGGLVVLLGAAAWRLVRDGITPEQEQAILQNVWVVMAVYVAAVAAETYGPWGYIGNSLGGLCAGLLAAHGTLFLVGRYGGPTTRERQLVGWACMGVGSLGIGRLLGTWGPLTNLWLVFWLTSAGIIVYVGSQLDTGEDSQTMPSNTEP